MNGSYRFTYQLSLDAPQGTYAVTAAVNDNLVAAAQFSVIWDELNYLGKRFALLEATAAKQQFQMDIQHSRYRALEQQYSWTIVFLYLAIFVVVFILFVTFVFPIGAMARLLWRWKYPIHETSLKAHERAFRAIVNPPGAAEIAYLFPNRRAYRPPLQTDPIWLAYRRRVGREGYPPQLPQEWLDPRVKPAPIRRRPIKVPKAAETADSSKERGGQ